MPANEWCPRVQLHCTFDARQWSGAQIITRGGGALNLGVYTAAGAGLFNDVIDFLSGRGHVNDDLPAQIAADWIVAGGPGAPVFSCGIDANDRVWIESDTQAFTVVDVVAGFGFTAPTLSAGAGPFRATAPSNWTRGNTVARLSITPAGGGAAFGTPQYPMVRQSIPCILRGYGPADADAVAWPTLEDTDGVYVRWGIDADGHVWWSTPQAAPGPAGALTWLSATLRDRLGFTGAEVATVVPSGAVNALLYRAILPCPGVLAPSRPLAEPLIRLSDVVADAARTLGGDVYRVEHSHALGWTAQVLVDGPLDDGEDLWTHYLRRWVPYQADRVTLYQDGDTRRRGDLTSGDVYGLLRTVEYDGFRGRIIGRLAPSHGTVTEMLPSERIYRRAPLTVRLCEVPGA